jgi:PEP-CTERM motif
MRLTGKFLAPTLLLSSLLLPNLCFANSGTDFSNSGGTVTGTTAGLSLTGSTLIAVIGFNGGGLTTGDLGSVSFSTGALNSGSLAMGGTFADGGMFEVDGNGTGGLPNGVVFSGTFSGTVTWTLTTLANGTHNYTLTGVVTGMMGGANVNGVTVQLTINTGKGFFNGTTLISGGDTTVASSVPEPSTLAMFGTGALAFASALRRRILPAR